MKRTLYRIHRGLRRQPWGMILGIFLLIVTGFGLMFVFLSPVLIDFRSSLLFEYLLKMALTLPIGWYVWICKQKTPLTDRIIATIPLLVLWSSFIPMTLQIHLLLWTVLLYGMIGCWLYLHYLDQTVRTSELMKCVGFETLFYGIVYGIGAFRYSLVGGMFSLPILLSAIIAAILVAAVMVILLIKRWLILWACLLYEQILCVIIASVLTFLLTAVTVLHLNYALDFDEPTTAVACVEDKEHTYTTKGGSHYYLILDLNGEKIRLDVSESDYFVHEISDDFAIKLYEGAFGVPFYLSGE